jgi:hypothetical protein
VAAYTYATTAGMSITIDGEIFECQSEQALRWVKVLTNHPDEWISGAELRS